MAAIMIQEYALKPGIHERLDYDELECGRGGTDVGGNIQMRTGGGAANNLVVRLTSASAVDPEWHTGQPARLI